MRVIGVGLPRTGTLSQKIALEMLGLGPCYHMVSVIGDLGQVPLWERAVAGDRPWGEIYAGYQSTVDWPGGFFYKQLIEAYPDAKVVLSVRDPQRWEQSMRNTIWRMLSGDNLAHHLSAARAQVDPQWAAFNALTSSMLWTGQGTFAGCDTGDRDLTDVMHEYNAEVKATVPSERLLVWQVTEGWGPLCEFLGVPVPDEPFPHVNDTAMFDNRVIEGSLAALTKYWAARSVSPGAPPS